MSQEMLLLDAQDPMWAAAVVEHPITGGARLVIAPADPLDERQLWEKEEWIANQPVTDERGNPVFALISYSPASGCWYALRKPPESAFLTAVRVQQEELLDESFMWIESRTEDGFVFVTKPTIIVRHFI